MALDAIQVLGGNGYINEYPTGPFRLFFFFFEREGERGRKKREETKASSRVFSLSLSPLSLNETKRNENDKRKPAGRILRDAKLYEIGAGTSEIRRLVIGRELMREAAEAEGGR